MLGDGCHDSSLRSSRTVSWANVFADDSQDEPDVEDEEDEEDDDDMEPPAVSRKRPAAAGPSDAMEAAADPAAAAPADQAGGKKRKGAVSKLEVLETRDGWNFGWTPTMSVPFPETPVCWPPDLGEVALILPRNLLGDLGVGQTTEFI